MKRHIAILLFIMTLCFDESSAQCDSTERHLKIKVPTKYIEKLRQYDGKQNNIAMVSEFERFVKPDLSGKSKDNEKNYSGLLNVIFVNLDDDAEEELIGLFGRTEESPTLAVFKMIDKSWYLLYIQPFRMFYTPPTLEVTSQFSTNKTFYIRWLYERGTGVYADAYHFFRLIDNKVHRCLVLINRAHLHGWGLYLNQTIQMKFKFKYATADDLWVKYDYNFFPGPVFENDLPWDSHEEIPFAKGSKDLKYHWDEASLTYKPETIDKPDELNNYKISCFASFANDTLFVKAFDYEIKQTLQNGKKEQKELLQKYLDIVATGERALAPNK